MQITININNSDLIVGSISEYSDINDIKDFFLNKEIFKNNIDIELCSSNIALNDCISEVTVQGFETFKEKLKQEIKKQYLKQLEDDLKW